MTGAAVKFISIEPLPADLGELIARSSSPPPTEKLHASKDL